MSGNVPKRFFSNGSLLKFVNTLQIFTLRPCCLTKNGWTRSTAKPSWRRKLPSVRIHFYNLIDNHCPFSAKYVLLLLPPVWFCQIFSVYGEFISFQSCISADVFSRRTIFDVSCAPDQQFARLVQFIKIAELCNFSGSIPVCHWIPIFRKALNQK